MFVANRIHQIKENTRSDHWKHVSNKENPTDDASCELDPRKETSNSCWFHGPSFYSKWNRSGQLKTAA